MGLWILPDHNKFSAYAQDTAGSSLDLKEQASLLSQSLMWRSKPGRLQTWSTRLKREKWLQHLSTRTLKPSRMESFEEKWTASLAAIPASRSQQQESDKEQTTHDTSGLGSQTAFDFAGQDGVSLKTSKDTLPRGCAKSWTSWEDLVTHMRRDYSQRVKSAHRTSASGCSSWPTASSRDHKDCSDPRTWNCKEKRKRNDQLARAVYYAMDTSGPPAPANPSTNGKSQGCVEMWRTPKANEPLEDFRKVAERRERMRQAGDTKTGDLLSLNQQVQKDLATSPVANATNGVATKDGNWTTPCSDDTGNRSKPYAQGGKALSMQAKQQWATPQARDFKSGLGKQERQYKELAPQVERPARDTEWPTPSSAGSTGGPTGLAGGSGNRAKMKRIMGGEVNAKLNPDWVSQLMGIPVGWLHPRNVRNRTDELRLAGNGVVPATACKAIITLSKELTPCHP